MLTARTETAYGKTMWLRPVWPVKAFVIQSPEIVILE